MSLGYKIESANKLCGEISFPGDKSISHRIAIISAVSNSELVVDNFPNSLDLKATINCLMQLGCKIDLLGKGKVRIKGVGLDGLLATDEPLYCGNSGTTMRLLSGVLAAQKNDYILIGDKFLNRRPMERVSKPLRAMGANITTTEGHAPIYIKAVPKLAGINWEMEVPSAQVKSAILLASLCSNKKSNIHELYPTRDHTELMLDYFRENNFKIDSYTIAGDISSAAFFIVAATILEGSFIEIKNILLNPRRTGIIKILKDMGANIIIKDRKVLYGEEVGNILVRSAKLKGIEIDKTDIPDIIDEIPALAVAAIFAEGKTKISGAEELRIKESDRLKAITNGLNTLGIKFVEKRDGFEILGISELDKDIELNCFDDHRIAMAWTILGLKNRANTVIDNYKCIDVSFPEFYNIIKQIKED